MRKGVSLPQDCFSLLYHASKWIHVFFIHLCIDLEMLDQQWMILKATSVTRKPHVCGSFKM